jgi:DNA-binding response OmpR family regulator
MVSTLIKSDLDKSGFFIHQAFQSDAALEAVAKYQPDIVILDIGLPSLDGFQICHQVREIYDGPITILSSNDRDKEQITAFQLGADDYIVKPVSSGVLRCVLKLCCVVSPCKTTYVHQVFFVSVI